MDAIKNFVKVEVSIGYNSSTTSVVLKSGDGDKLPNPAVANYNLVWWNSTDYADPSDDPYVSIVRVTGKSSDTLTIVQPSSATGNNYNGETSSNVAQDHNIADKVYKMALSPTYKIFKDIDDQIPVKSTSNEVNTGSDDSKFITSLGLRGSVLFNVIEGFLINGKIVPSVSSNNLTIAIKGMNGNDPSATNPVFVRINGVMRVITSALSVTTNAATNWFNAGSSELATKEIDYFVYLGYNSTDGVTIGFSRIPYANSYGEFSTTNTNEKFCAISTITHASSTDAYVNIGRFAATLSAGAGYTWSVPTFTSINLIQKPIYETRKLGWSPVYTGFTGSVTNVVASYQLRGSLCYISLFSYGTSNNAAFNFTLPFNYVGAGDSGYTPVIAFIMDNSNWIDTGVAGLLDGGNTIKLGKTASTAAGNSFGGFTTSNQKAVSMRDLMFIL